MRVCVLGTGLVFMRGYDYHGKPSCLGHVRTTRVYNTVGCLNVPPVVWWCGGVVDGDGRYDLLD